MHTAKLFRGDFELFFTYLAAQCESSCFFQVGKAGCNGSCHHMTGPSFSLLGLPSLVFSQECISMALPWRIYSFFTPDYVTQPLSVLITLASASVYGGIEQTVLPKKGKEKEMAS